MSANLVQILAIGGSDPSGGAGIQADLKTIHAHGAFGLTVVTAVTVQNTCGVRSSHPVPPAVVRDQIRALCDDFTITAVKIGMLASAQNVAAVADELRLRALPHVVVDPVILSSSGFALLSPEGVELLRERLLPLARVCTPNLLEAEILAGITIHSRDETQEAARRIRALGPQAVVIKGGHAPGAIVTDLLLDGDELRLFESARIEPGNAHGTGCTLASALAVRLAQGYDLTTALEKARAYVAGAIRRRLTLGHGDPPLDHFPFLSDQDWGKLAGGGERG